MELFFYSFIEQKCNRLLPKNIIRYKKQQCNIRIVDVVRPTDSQQSTRNPRDQERDFVNSHTGPG